MQRLAIGALLLGLAVLAAIIGCIVRNPFCATYACLHCDAVKVERCYGFEEKWIWRTSEVETSPPDSVPHRLYTAIGWTGSHDHVWGMLGGSGAGITCALGQFQSQRGALLHAEGSLLGALHSGNLTRDQVRILAEFPRFPSLSVLLPPADAPREEWDRFWTSYLSVTEDERAASR